MTPEKSVRKRDEDGDTNPSKRAHTSNQSQSMEITDLIDDCLIEIFSYLSLVDLAAVKKSCKRFNYAADECYRKLFLDDRDFRTNGDDVYNYETTELILEQFGNVIGRVNMAFSENHKKCKCKYLLLLKHCTAMSYLRLKGIDFSDLSIDPFQIEPLKNITELTFMWCSGTLNNFKRFLGACDPLKLKTFNFYSHGDDVSNGLLSYVAEWMVNIGWLTISVDARIPSYAANMAKLKCLKKLKSLNILSGESPLPIDMIIDPLTELSPLEWICLENITIPNKITARAINNLLNVSHLKFLSESKIPANILDQITCFPKKDSFHFVDGDVRYSYELGQ